jgi:hypothetical protein
MHLLSCLPPEVYQQTFDKVAAMQDWYKQVAPVAKSMVRAAYDSTVPMDASDVD